MFNSIISKTLYDNRAMILAWSLGIFALNLFVVVLFVEFGKNSALQEQYRSLPVSLQAFTGSLDFSTVSKYLSSQLYFNNATMLLWIMAIGYGVNAIAGEEQRGTLETTLATRVSKMRFYSQKLAAGMIIFAIVNIVGLIAVWVGLGLISESMDPIRLLQATMMLWVYTSLLGAFSLAVGAATGRKSLTIGITIATIAIMLIVYTFSQSVSWMKGFEFITWNYYYAHAQTVINGINVTDLAVLIGSMVAVYGLGYTLFKARDISN